MPKQVGQMSAQASDCPALKNRVVLTGNEQGKSGSGRSERLFW